MLYKTGDKYSKNRSCQDMEIAYNRNTIYCVDSGYTGNLRYSTKVIKKIFLCNIRGMIKYTTDV